MKIQDLSPDRLITAMLRGFNEEEYDKQVVKQVKLALSDNRLDKIYIFCNGWETEFEQFRRNKRVEILNETVKIDKLQLYNVASWNTRFFCSKKWVQYITWSVIATRYKTTDVTIKAIIKSLNTITDLFEKGDIKRARTKLKQQEEKLLTLVRRNNG